MGGAGGSELKQGPTWLQDRLHHSPCRPHLGRQAVWQAVRQAVRPRRTSYTSSSPISFSALVPVSLLQLLDWLQ